MSKNDLRWLDPQGAPQGSVAAVGADGKIGMYPSSSPIAGASVNRLVMQRTSSGSIRFTIGDSNGFSVLSDDGTTLISSASQMSFGTSCYGGNATSNSTSGDFPHGANGPFYSKHWYNSGSTYYYAWAPTYQYAYAGSTYLQYTFPTAKHIRSVKTYDAFSPSWQLQRWTPATAWTNVGSPFVGSYEAPESGASTDWRLLSAFDGQCRILHASFSEYPYHGSEASNDLYKNDAYLWLIKNPTTSDVRPLFSASATAPTLPSGYTKKKLVGRMLDNPSNNAGNDMMLPFYQENGDVYFKMNTSDLQKLYYVVSGSADFGTKLPPAIFRKLKAVIVSGGASMLMTPSLIHTNTGLGVVFGGTFNASYSDGGRMTADIPTLAGSLAYTTSNVNYVGVFGGELNVF